jgi:hypothetical protein
MNKTITNEVILDDHALQRIVEILGKSIKLRVVYRPDQQRMTEEAIEICQKNARLVLKTLAETLPDDHWLREEIGPGDNRGWSKRKKSGTAGLFNGLGWTAAAVRERSCL